MARLIDDLLRFFQFNKFTEVVASVCIVLLFAALLGGMIASLARAFGGPLKPMKTSETSGFRLLMIMELFLLIVIVYYHLALTARIEALQAVFWVTTMTALPVLWFLGAQITQVIFWSRIQNNKKAYKKMATQKRVAKHKKMRQQIAKESGPSNANRPRAQAGGGARRPARR